MVQSNQFIDSDLSDRTSLIHLLDNNDSEDDNEAHIVKHSPYYYVIDMLPYPININHIYPNRRGGGVALLIKNGLHVIKQNILLETVLNISSF